MDTFYFVCSKIFEHSIIYRVQYSQYELKLFSYTFK